tara:strand:+ start:652 stop:792 length:141 start_codon:yes stop_codon:yes gene_type:complete
MNWNNNSKQGNGLSAFSDLETPVGKSGANESALLVAILWGIAIALS